MKADDLAARLLATFRAELDEQLRTMNEDLLALEATPGDAELLKRLFRGAHTLKGAAHAAGVPQVESICHAMEARLAGARDRGTRLQAPDFALLFEELDQLAAIAGTLQPGEASGAADGAPGAEGTGVVDAAEPDEAGAAPAPSRSAAAPSTAPPEPPAGSGAQDVRTTHVRIDEAKLDAVLATAAELVVSARNVERILAGLSDAPKPASAEARRLRQLSAAVREDMRRLRMRPFGEACEPLPRLVRDLAASSGKKVELHIEGADVEADRAILDGVREAMLHLVRNAIDHGIEPPDVRREVGKPRVARLVIAATIHGDRLVVTVEDDGTGLALDALRAQLRRAGIPEPEDRRQWARVLFEGGLSSRTEATTISGRGVGLNAARAAIVRVRGEIGVSWEEGKGTTFRLDCPLTLAMQRLVVVSVSGHLLAFPSADVERLERIEADGIMRLEGRDVLPDEEGPVRLAPLAALLGPRFAEGPRMDRMMVVRVRTPQGRIALVVDELLSEEEALIRSLERVHRSGVQIAGVALLGQDRVALVLRTSAIVESGLAADGTDLASRRKHEEVAAPRILVVDDSITTRTLEQNVLETAGYHVTTAPDGAEAWRLLQEKEFDLVLSDVEMPRMDGLELCRAIRSSKRTETLPVVLLTALATPEQQARGLEMGADAYLIKSSFDQNELLEVLRQLAGAPA